MSQVLAIWICPKRRLTFPWLRTNLMMRMINSEAQKQHPRTQTSRTTDAWSQHLILIEINYIGNTSFYRMWTSWDDSSRSHTQCVCVSAELLCFLFFISPLYTWFNYCGRVDCWKRGRPLKNNFIGNHHFTSHLQGVGCDLVRQPEPLVKAAREWCRSNRSLSYSVNILYIFANCVAWKIQSDKSQLKHSELYKPSYFPSVLKIPWQSHLVRTFQKSDFFLSGPLLTHSFYLSLSGVCSCRLRHCLRFIFGWVCAFGLHISQYTVMYLSLQFQMEYLVAWLGHWVTRSVCFRRIRITRRDIYFVINGNRPAF